MTVDEPKTVEVTVLSLEEEFKIAMQKATSGRELYELVCRSLRLRENQFFGLFFETEDKKTKYWLKRSRNVLEQLPKAQNIRLTFSVRFYPEDLEQELIEDRTRHVFYLHVKRLVQAGEIRSLHEDVVRLAALAAQAKYGDFKENFLTNMSLTYLLPHYTLDDYLVTKNVWISKIEAFWKEYYGRTNEEAEIEYLKLAQNFDMFGMEHFDVKDDNKRKCLLAIGPTGLVLCERESKSKRLLEFNWNQIENFMIRSRKFIIKMKADNENSAKNQIFFVKKAKTNKLLFEQSVGNHELYKLRKLPDSVDLQHMKLHALEERDRRKEEHANLINERKLRQDAEKRREEAEFQLQKFQLAAAAAKEALQNSEKSQQNLLEKLHRTEEEAQLLKLASSETGVQRSQLLSALSVVYAIINNYYAENSEQERSEILQKIQGALLLLEVLPPDFLLTLMADCLVNNLPSVEELQPLLNVGIMKLPKVSPV